MLKDIKGERGRSMVQLAMWVTGEALGSVSLRGRLVKEQQTQEWDLKWGETTAHSIPTMNTGFRLGYRPWTVRDSSQVPEPCPRDCMTHKGMVLTTHCVLTFSALRLRARSTWRGGVLP